MTPEELKRLANYKTQATFNRTEVDDYFQLLAKELIIKAEAEAIVEEVVVEVAEAPKKRGRHKKIVN